MSLTGKALWIRQEKADVQKHLVRQVLNEGTWNQTGLLRWFCVFNGPFASGRVLVCDSSHDALVSPVPLAVSFCTCPDCVTCRPLLWVPTACVQPRPKKQELGASG